LPRHRSFAQVLGFGSAYGDELLPVVDQAEEITIVDPSDAFRRDQLGGIPVRYRQPSLDGRLALPDSTFDLTTCFGVLHHIANVTFVFGELARTLKPNGYLLVREPIVSMGDWRMPRRGLTKRERGIPLHLLRQLVQRSGLEVMRESLCDFPLTRRIFGPFRDDVFNSPFAVRVDALLAQAFSWNLRYHARHNIARLRPTSVFLVVRKPPRGVASSESTEDTCAESLA
jgi:SAM-dependent methyltransferase